MSKHKVFFLGKEFLISDELPLFITILNKFEEYREELLSKLVTQIKENTYSGGAEQDFIFWRSSVTNIAKNIIRDASMNDVYDITENELVDDNKGFQMLHSTCANTIDLMAKNLEKTMLDYMDGYDNAYSNAASNIIGSGVSVWTSSLSGALLYSAMEGSVIKKQARQADKEFCNALDDLSKRTNNNLKKEEIRIKTQVYYPGCRKSIDILITYMMEIYLDKLDKNNIMGYSDIKKYDLSQSDEILKNISIVDKKTEVLYKAFERCPYNISVFYEALKLKLFDDDCLEILKFLNLLNNFGIILDDEIGVIETTKNLKKNLNNNDYLIHIRALISDKTDIGYRRILTNNIYELVLNNYLRLKNSLNNEGYCKNIADRIEAKEDAYSYAREYIDNIISEDDFCYLQKDCGHNQLLEEIMPENYDGNMNIESINDFYTTCLAEKCIILIEERVIKQQKEKDEQERKLKVEEEKREKKKVIVKKIVVTSIIVGIIVLCIGVCYVNKDIIMNKINNEEQYEQAQKLINENKYLQAQSVLLKIDEYKDSREIIDSLDIKKEKYLKYESTKKAPELKEITDEQFTDLVHSSSDKLNQAISDICSPFGTDEEKDIDELCDVISKAADELDCVIIDFESLDSNNPIIKDFKDHFVDIAVYLQKLAAEEINLLRKRVVPTITFEDYHNYVLEKVGQNRDTLDEFNTWVESMEE